MRIAGGRSAKGAFAVAAALALGGCVTTSTPTVSPTAAEGATIIFESIDGPPRAVSTKLARSLYDAGRKRAFRLNGEERAVGPTSWAAANDAMLQRIASTSINQLMTFIASDRTPGASLAAASEAPMLPFPVSVNR